MVTASMLPHRMTRGYGEPFGQVVETVNGTKIRSLRHLVETLRDSKDEFLTFSFAEDGSETLVFRRQAIFDATEPLIRQNGIPRQGSDDILTVLDAKHSKPNAARRAYGSADIRGYSGYSDRGPRSSDRVRSSEENATSGFGRPEATR